MVQFNTYQKPIDHILFIFPIYQMTIILLVTISKYLDKYVQHCIMSGVRQEYLNV